MSGKIVHVAVRRRPARQARRRIVHARSASPTGSRVDAGARPSSTPRAAITTSSRATLDSLDHAGRSGAEERRAQAARRRPQERSWSQAAAGSQADVDTARRRAGDGAIAGAVRQAAARHRRLSQLLGNPDLPLEQFPEYAQAKAALDHAQRDLDHTVVRAPIVRHRHASRQHPARPLRRRRHAGAERDRRPGALGRRQSEGNRHHLSARRAEGDARRSTASPTTPSRAPSLRSAPAPARNSRSCRRRTPPATGSRWCSACRCASPSTRTRTRACCAPA